MFDRDICNLAIASDEDTDFVKTKAKETALSLFRKYYKKSWHKFSIEELLALTSLSKNKAIVIEKPEKKYFCCKGTYIKRMDSSKKRDQRKFRKVILKLTFYQNLVVEQKDCIDTIFKHLTDYNSMSKEICMSLLKPVGTRPGTMYGIRKVHKQHVVDWPYLRQFYRF